jgi:hypothetical protein
VKIHQILALLVLLLILIAFVFRSKTRPQQVIVWDNPPKVTWLENEIYILEQNGMRYQTGLHPNGTFVWRKYNVTE